MDPLKLNSDLENNTLRESMRHSGVTKQTDYINYQGYFLPFKIPLHRLLSGVFCTLWYFSFKGLLAKETIILVANSWGSELKRKCHLIRLFPSQPSSTSPWMMNWSTIAPIAPWNTLKLIVRNNASPSLSQPLTRSTQCRALRAQRTERTDNSIERASLPSFQSKRTPLFTPPPPPSRDGQRGR